MKTTITSSDRISNATYHRRCTSQGQRNWWLRNTDTGSFVAIPSTRGDCHFEAELDLAPGTYTLGTGPVGSHGVRQTITVA